MSRRPFRFDYSHHRFDLVVAAIEAELSGDLADLGGNLPLRGGAVEACCLADSVGLVQAVGATAIVAPVSPLTVLRAEVVRGFLVTELAVPLQH
jgi:hypothetical protein